MRVNICKCSQCRAVRRKASRNAKVFFRRFISKKRRKGNDDKVFNFYWA